MFTDIAAHASDSIRPLILLGTAFFFSSLIGLERELRLRSAGLRTHALVGLGAALMMLVSKFGFFDVVGGSVSLDPSRVAAQIVSGIGFIGAGLIFVRKDSVRGLTTAAAVWLTAGIGMACGAGLVMLGAAGTLGFFIVVLVYTPLVNRIMGRDFTLDITISRQSNATAAISQLCNEHGFTVGGFSIAESEGDKDHIRLHVSLHGPVNPADLLLNLHALQGVTAVSELCVPRLAV